MTQDGKGVVYVTFQILGNVDSLLQHVEFKSTAVLPYTKGLSEQLRRCLQQQGVALSSCRKLHQDQS